MRIALNSNSVHIQIINTGDVDFVPTEDWFLVHEHTCLLSSDEFSIFDWNSAEGWMSISEDERREFHDRDETG